MATPHYVTTPGGPVHLWLDGDGPTLVAVAGPVRAAEPLVDDLRVALPGWRVIGVEPPGLGASAGSAAKSAADAAATVADALDFLAGEPFVLAAADLSVALLPALVERLRPTTTLLLDVDAALGWLEHGTLPPDLTPRDDGSHLNATWSFVRDRRLVRPDAPTLPVASGGPLPTVDDLAASFLAAATEPAAFTRYWEQAAATLPAALAELAELGDATRGATDAIAAAVATPPATSTAAPPATAPGPALWHSYVETAYGRVHLRRAGTAGRPLLVLPTGGGSSAQFAPVVTGLAATRTVVAMDYFGNGRSVPLDRMPDIADLAREGFAVADALGWDDFDVWGSHTGANTALEMTIMAPERIGKGVYEAPVMVTPEFRDDLLANYFPDFAPDKFGLHLQHVWNWRRDMFFYWPWYRVDQANARAIGIPTAADLHLYNVGILESGTTYDRAYRAGFGYDTWSRLPELRRPAILTAGPDDMLANALEDAAALVPDGLLRIVPTPTTVWWPDPEPAAAEQTLQVYRDFLG
jgi:hypothetical protein